MREVNSWGPTLTLSRVFVAGNPPCSHDGDEENNAFMPWQGYRKGKNFVMLDTLGIFQTTTLQEERLYQTLHNLGAGQLAKSRAL